MYQSPDLSVNPVGAHIAHPSHGCATPVVFIVNDDEPDVGCRMWDWHPALEDMVIWTGRCKGDPKSGHGIVQWFEHGRQNHPATPGAVAIEELRRHEQGLRNRRT